MCSLAISHCKIFKARGMFSHLDLQQTNQLKSVERSMNKTEVKRLSEYKMDILNEQ